MRYQDVRTKYWFQQSPKFCLGAPSAKRSSWTAFSLSCYGGGKQLDIYCFLNSVNRVLVSPNRVFANGPV